jgi:hypothetical protein
MVKIKTNYVRKSKKIMKTNFYKSGGALLFGIVLLLNACEDDFYTINNSFYDGKQITVKNPMNGDTLRIEQFNTDQIMIEEVSDSTLVLDSKAFIYEVEHDSILTIGNDGTITPVSIGETRVDIIFRANASLNTSIVVAVYKDYHPVEYLQVASSVSKLLVEKDFSLDLAPYVFVFPGHADNKRLHFSLDEASRAFASITDEGVITGIAPGTIAVHVVSDDNPNAFADFQLTAVNEIEITEITLHAKLNNVTLGTGEKINLNTTTGVKPANVNEVNRRLTFELLEGAGVVSIDPVTNVLTAIGSGTALIKAVSKNGLSKEFTVNVDADKKDLTRAFWTVNTSIVYSTGNGYVVDGSTGKPEDMFDETTTTFLSLTKPGKTYSNCATPAGTLLNFVVDMQSPCKFNSIRWNHRSGNSYTYLRVWGIEVHGSNDGESWETIKTIYPLPNTEGAANAADNARHDLPLDGEFEYQFVRVIVTNWSDNSGGAASGSTMQIAEFGLSKF